MASLDDDSSDEEYHSWSKTRAKNRPHDPLNVQSEIDIIAGQNYEVAVPFSQAIKITHGKKVTNTLQKRQIISRSRFLFVLKIFDLWEYKAKLWFNMRKPRARG